MADKPEYYALTDVLAALDGLKSPETFALDIATGALPVGAVLRDVLCMPEHKAKEMPGIVFRAAWLPLFLAPLCAGTAWKEGEARLARWERTPRALGTDGPAECYLAERVAFPDPPLVTRADLVVFRFQLAPYMNHTGHADRAPKVAVTRRTDDNGETTMCGEVYSISRRSALEVPVKGSQRWSWSLKLVAPSAKTAARPIAAEPARWELVRVKQRDYGAELDDYLERALKRAAPPPSAADVLEEWAKNPPHGIKVDADRRGFRYSSGGMYPERHTTAKSLSQAIKRRVRLIRDG